jgi:hypothetical protein
MKRLWIAAFAVFIGTATQALAQRPGDQPARNVPNGTGVNRPVSPRTLPPPEYPRISPGEIQATPEMWFYEQSMRQYHDPKLAVRQAAEFRAEQRQRRLESMKWFGLSNQRPWASSDPLHNDYSPRWTGNNYYYPERWSGASGTPVVVVRPDGTRVY